MSREDHLEEEACLWICRMDRGLSAFEKQQLITWGNQHYTHKECLFSLLLLWEDHDKKRVLETLFPPSNHNKDKLSNSVNRAVVASLCMVVLVASIWFYPTLNENSVQQENIASSQILQTEIGERHTFTLADGSKVQLNTNSLIEVAYSPTQRQIILARGEATFTVVKDKAHPFIVTVGNTSFTALGTVFNVEKMTGEDVALVVTEGKVLLSDTSVLVEHVKHKLDFLQLEQLPGVVINLGEKVLIENKIQGPIEHLTLTQLDKEFAWQKGMLIFDAEPLAQVITEINRYTDIPIQILSAELNNLQISGYFKTNDVPGLLQALQDNFDIEYKKTNAQNIQLYSSPKSS